MTDDEIRAKVAEALPCEWCAKGSIAPKGVHLLIDGGRIYDAFHCPAYKHEAMEALVAEAVEQARAEQKAADAAISEAETRESPVEGPSWRKAAWHIAKRIRAQP